MSENSFQELLVDNFKKSRDSYEQFCGIVSRLLRGLIEINGIKVMSITSRCKDISSFETKIARKDKDYRSLDEITDLAGLRVVVHLSSEVDSVYDLIRREFDVDMANSPDKRIPVNPNAFGYASQHVVAKLLPSRSILSEYSAYKDFKCEIQIRSVLQHAWAEIEHGLGYKNTLGIPFHLQRRFARIAGLLEIADDEFNDITAHLKTYETDLLIEVTTNPHLVRIDLQSLKVAFSVIELFKDLDGEVSKLTENNIALYGFASLSKHKVDQRDVSQTMLNVLVQRLSELEIQTIDDLCRQTKKHLNEIKEYAEKDFRGLFFSGNISGASVLLLTEVLDPKYRIKFAYEPLL